MPSTNHILDRRRSSRKRSRMNSRHDDSDNNVTADARYIENTYPDWDEIDNERLIDKFESLNPMRESLEEDDDDDDDDDEIVNEYIAKHLSSSVPKESTLVEQHQNDNNTVTINQPSLESKNSEPIEFAVLPSGKFDQAFESRIKQELQLILRDHCRFEQIDCNDKSIYTGEPGISLLYHHLSTCGKAFLEPKLHQEITSQATKHLNQYLISIQLPHTHNSKCPSYFCGDLGLYTFCTIARNQQRLHREMLTRTLSCPGPRSSLSQSAPSNTGLLVQELSPSSKKKHSNQHDQQQSHHQHNNLVSHNINSEQIRDEPETSIMAEKILELIKMQEQQGTPDELLYGRSGGLYAMLLIRQQLPKQCIIKDEHIVNQINLILSSGKSMESFGRPLFYSWHGKEYVGIAHGYTGILYMLLEANKYLSKDQLKLIRDAINFVESTKYASCNYPSSIGSETDWLVHWCHGAPGVMHMLIKAYQVYRDKSLFESALQCGEVIWKRGLLRKGFGLCHGIAGNAYAFLHLYQLTRDLRHLYRAGKFAQFYFENRDKIAWRADSQASLYEGYAGLAYFLSDLLNPSEAKFPAFQLTISSPVYSSSVDSNNS